AQPFPIQNRALPIPPAQPIQSPPVVVEEGTGLFDEVPGLPKPAAQHSGSDFRRPGFPAPTTTTTPAPRPSGDFTPSPTLTCSTVRCPSGSVCRLEHNRGTRRDEPVCVLHNNSNNENSPNSCARVRCSAGFNCEMQQTSSCSRRPCPLNPVCVQAPVTPAPTPSCDTVRCGPGTVCRLQIAEQCTIPPCHIVTACVSPCASVTCPSNSQCIVDNNSLATSCIPNGPVQPTASCSRVRCGFGERCVVAKSCNWSRECKDEAKCVKH
ncbi:hypothetical protein PFISCL1PPCAC_1473, partial [Pristionchus fissidentatus]